MFFSNIYISKSLFFDYVLLEFEVPPTKAWRIFTKKPQLKLNKPKLIKKPNTQYDSKKTCKKPSLKKPSWKKPSWPTSLSVHPKKFKIIKRRSRAEKPHLAYIQKRGNLPVFVDQLVEHADSMLNAKACEKSHSNNSHAVVDCEKNNVLALHKNGVGNMDEKVSSADEMWESLVMDSSQMERVDEEAEEFIAKFRAEIQNQETLARYL